MLTLKQAMALHANEIESLKEQMIQDIKAKQELNAYIETPELNENDKGKIPILIKDNICVKDSKLTCASKILTCGVFLSVLCVIQPPPKSIAILR